MFVDYSNSILTYVSSIRNYFGLDSSYKSNADFDEVLKDKKPKNIFLILIDAMGANLIERKLPEDSFVRRNMLYKTSTVFPATTTAATTSIRNGKAPNENGWLGWTQYIKELDDVIIPFLGVSYYKENVSYGGRSYMHSLVPVTDTETELNDMGIAARKLFPSFEEDGCENFDTMCNRLIGYSKNDTYRYVYAYWDKYDTYMHEYGTDDSVCDTYLAYINAQLERLSKSISNDTMLVVVADHGQITVGDIYNLYNSKYDKYFRHLPALETRAQAFYIKEGMLEEFEEEFRKDFSDRFVLLSHKEVVDSHLFGDFENHPKFEEYIGDYLAIAKTNMCFAYEIKKGFKLKGHHAGLCDDELMIPVIVYQR